MEQDYIQHFGILGMHWGIRRTPEELGHTPKGQQKARKIASKNGIRKIEKTRKRFEKAKVFEKSQASKDYDELVKSERAWDKAMGDGEERLINFANNRLSEHAKKHGQQSADDHIAEIWETSMNDFYDSDPVISAAKRKYGEAIDKYKQSSLKEAEDMFGKDASNTLVDPKNDRDASYADAYRYMLTYAKKERSHYYSGYEGVQKRQNK